jgi:hypothetical protein
MTFRCGRTKITDGEACSVTPLVGGLAPDGIDPSDSNHQRVQAHNLLPLHTGVDRFDGGLPRTVCPTG